MSENETTPPAPAPSAPEPLDVGQAVWQLRILVCGLGAALLVLSLAFNVFVWKQNRNINAVAMGRKSQAAQLEMRVKQLTLVANDLGNYSAGRPELTAIFAKYGVQLKPIPTTPATQP
jgi:hypothetical protein